MKQCRGAHEIKTGKIKLKYGGERTTWAHGGEKTTWAHWHPFDSAYGDDMEANDYLITPDKQCKRLHDRSRWAIGQDGKIESAQCEDMVMTIKTSQTLANSDIVLAVSNELGWNQEWNTQSKSAILLMQNGKSSQEWNAIFASKCIGRMSNIFNAFVCLVHNLAPRLLLQTATTTTPFCLGFLALNR